MTWEHSLNKLLSQLDSMKCLLTAHDFCTSKSPFMNEALPSKDVRDEPLSPDTERDGNETMEVFSKNHQLHLSLDA